MGAYHLCVSLFIATFISSRFVNAFQNFCRPQNFGEDSVVCECDAQYCDTYEPEMPKDGDYLLVTSNKAGLRFYEQQGLVEPHQDFLDVDCRSVIYNKTVILRINKTQTYQKILGFGGGFTDATGYNIAHLSNDTQEQLMRSFFTPQGLNYNMGRTPIGHTDFSVSEYYYTSTPYDVNMTDWKLTEYDYDYKIPYINWAKKLMKDELYLLACLWTVPAWMRRKGQTGIRTSIKEEYFDAYAKYITKYIEAYKDKGIDLWAVGYANEPFINLASSLLDQEDTEMLWSTWPVKKLERFAVKTLKPALKKSGFEKTKILFFDDSLSEIFFSWTNKLAQREKIKETIDVLGIHSYSPFISPILYDKFHEVAPNIDIITSELTSGQYEGVKLGKWDRAEHYAKNYLRELNHFVSGWMDWNMVLNKESKPRFEKAAPCDASVIAFPEENKFYKQPSYYSIGHFSKFIPRGSARVKLDEVFPSVVQHGAVLRPDGLLSVVLFNESDDIVDARIQDEKGDVHVILSAKSINTIVFKI